MSSSTDTELAEWEAAFAAGAITLGDLLMLTLQAGKPASPALVALVEAAFTDHQEGRRQLADAFGIARCGNEAQAINAEILARQVHALVMELHERHPKGHEDHLALTLSGSRTKKTGETAFSRAAEIMRLSESAIAKHYYKAKSLHDRGKG
jgi:hypothetical protein